MTNNYRYRSPHSYKKHSVAKYVLWVLIGTGAILFFFVLFAKGIDKHEYVECLQWERWEEEYPLHYLLDWQIEQCKEHGIYFDN